MLMLSLSTSGPIASAAVIKDGQVLSREVGGHGRTHSETIMPLCEKALQTAGYTPKNMDAFGVDAGPGSFTGVRIGAATLKGIAFGKNKPCCAVSALEALAYNLRGTDGVVCALMDARRGQFYTATFAISGGEVTRLTPDEAKSGEEIARACAGQSALCLVGDGAEAALPFFGSAAVLAPPKIRYADGESVGLAALSMYKAGKTVPAEEFRPVYLRLPQAERERLARIEKEKTNDERL